jgi:hypothetical protein
MDNEQEQKAKATKTLLTIYLNDGSNRIMEVLRGGVVAAGARFDVADVYVF